MSMNKSDAKEQFLPGDAWGDIILALVIVSIADKILTHILHFTTTEGSAVVKPSIQHPCFTSQKLNQLPNLE